MYFGLGIWSSVLGHPYGLMRWGQAVDFGFRVAREISNLGKTLWGSEQ